MTENSPLRAAIEAQNAAFMRAAGNGDAAAIARLYTEGAWLLPPGSEIIQGRPGIEAFWASRFAGIAEVNLSTGDLLALGEDAAREVGSARITLRGEPEPISGKYVVVWKRVGDEWLLKADIWNSNA